jgi:hypothetical protein
MKGRIAMTYFSKPLMFACIIFVSAQANSQIRNISQVNSTAKAGKLEGMDYRKARTRIVALGWQPLSGDCGGGGTSDTLCRQYPEIGNCSGSGVGYCDMTFIKADRCLLVLTTGGAPQSRAGGGAIVHDVTFSRGKCSKDPNG